VLSPINTSILHALHKWRTLKIKSAYLQRKHALKKTAHLSDLICKFWIWIRKSKTDKYLWIQNKSRKPYIHREVVSILKLA
jgi:hypothetical protein